MYVCVYVCVCVCVCVCVRILLSGCLSRYSCLSQTVTFFRVIYFSQVLSLSIYIYIYIYIYMYMCLCVWVHIFIYLSLFLSIYFSLYRTLAWWLECLPMARETWVRSQVESYQRLKKWYLMPPCLTLSIIRYGSRVKWSNPGNGVAPSPTHWCSSYRKGSLRVTLDYGRQLTLLLSPPSLSFSLSCFLPLIIYIYIYICLSLSA